MHNAPRIARAARTRSRTRTRTRTRTRSFIPLKF